MILVKVTLLVGYLLNQNTWYLLINFFHSSHSCHLFLHLLDYDSQFTDGCVVYLDLLFEVISE